MEMVTSHTGLLDSLVDGICDSRINRNTLKNNIGVILLKNLQYGKRRINLIAILYRKIKKIKK
jgi:hypothetical protein